MTTTLRPFSYDYWQTPRDDWKSMGLKWQCFLTTCDGATFGKDQVRQDRNSEAPPNQVREWLNKPSKLMRNRADTPEDAIEWLKAQFEQYRAGMTGQQATFATDEERFGRALYDLRVGNDIAWGFWINGASTIVSMAILAVS